ncbi:Ribonuclease UK114 [Sciurus carolinensis]|uniref:Ribonuclease UK114 n=1 Tax=Sciurus carolinensis TaxID=30640 RepID=A0AA41T4J8_SCICA|nr:Ribonuclease UK114 [Sciurus carolinensis]
MDSSSRQFILGWVAAEAKQALKNVGETLKATDCDFTKALKATIWTADINYFNTVNAIYKQYFKSNFSAYQVADLPKKAGLRLKQ